MSSETPIFDATCRDVGSPDAADVPGHQAPTGDDAVTSDLAIPGGDRRPSGAGDR